MTLPATIHPALPDQAEKPKHDPKSKTGRILRLLQTQGTATNTELNRSCFRYSGRLHELRNEGYVIVTEKDDVNHQLFRYIYMGHRDTGGGL